MASKDKKYQLSEGRKKQLEQARRNAKNASKQSKPASNYLGGSTKKTTNTTKKTSGTQSRNNTVSRSTGGKSTVTNRNVRQADKVTGARPYQQSVRGLGNTVGITREGRQQRQDTARQNTSRTARTTRGTAIQQASTYLTGGNSSQSKTSSYAAAVRNGNKLPKASDDLRSRISAAQKQKANNLQRAMDTINANSVRWHSATPEEQTRLHNINNRIRQQYGMTYDDKLGNTYLPTASGDKNVSRPVNLMTGAAQPQTEFNSQEEKDARYIELQKEINRLNANYLDPTRKRFGLTDDKKADRDAKKQLVQVLKDEQQAITGGTSRLTQALYSIGNRARAAIPSAYDTAIQHGKNAAKSQENPEYNKLAEQEQTLELQLAGMPSMDADGKVPAEYMEVYNQLQDVRKRKDALTDKTPVDQNKWSQRTLKKAEEQQANATTGLTNGQKYAANTAISLAGNAPTMGLSAIPVVGPYLGAAAMGAQAAGQRMYELNSQGVAPNESFARGLVSGGIEMATEKLPLENLADIIRKGGSGFVKNALRQAGIEATEESASYLANYAADLAANDPNAQFSLEELAQNAAGGAIGGLVFAGMGTGVNTLMTRAEAARNGVSSSRVDNAPAETVTSIHDAAQGVQQGAVQANPPLRDINPKLRTAAQAAQESAQNAPAEITQRAQANEYLDQQDMPAAMSPADSETVYSYRYTNKDSPMSDYGHAMFVDDEYSSDGYGREGDYRYKVDQSRLTDISTLQEEIAEKLQEQYDNGMLPREIEEIMDFGVSAEQLAEEFNPDDIVMSAGAWDNGDLVQWFWDNIADPNDIYGIKTNDGAIVYDENMIEREDNPAQYVDTQQEALAARDISPKLVRAGAETAQSASQTAPQGITQAAGENAQAANMNDIRPKLTKAGEQNIPFDQNTVGAAQSAYKPEQKVSKVSSNTFTNSDLFNEAEKQSLKIFDKDGDALYDVVHEKQSLDNARQRLDTDYEGEKRDLPNKPNFSGEDNDTAMGILSRNLEEARKSGDYSDVDKWVKLIKEKGTEGGQLVQSFAKYSRTPEGILVQGQREIDAAIKFLEKTNPRKLKKWQEQGYLQWTGEDMQKASDYMKKAVDAGIDTQEGRTYEAKAAGVIAERIPVSTKDKIISLLMDNMLGNFRTLITRNAGGNAMFSAPEAIRENFVAAPIDWLASLKTGARTTYSSPLAKSAAWLGGMKKGTSEMISDIKNDVHTARSGDTTSVRAQQKTFKDKGLGKLGNAYDSFVGSMLEAGDRPFYEAAYAAKMADLEKARSQGKLTKDFDGKNFDTYAPKVAAQAAQEAVFQNNGTVAQAFSNIATGLGKLSKGTLGTASLQQSSLPFTKTPGNLVERSIEYSPFGLLKNGIQTGKEMHTGTFNQQRFVNETSRNIVGAAIFGLASSLVANGIVTGSLPDDQDEAEAMKNAGKQAYSINIGGNNYSYSWIPVIGPALAGSADFFQTINNMDASKAAAVWKAAEGYLNSAIFEQSSLSGLPDLFGGSYSTPVEGIGKSFASLPSQMVPSLVRQIATATDKYERQTYIKGDTVQSQLNSIKASIPGLRQTLPVKVDEQGNEQLNSQGRGLGSRLAENMILPYKLTSDQSNDVRNELMRLKKATGETTQFQQKITYTVERTNENEKPQKKNLTAAQSMQYQKVFGQTSTAAIRQLMKSGVYDDLSDKEKVKIITAINSYAKTLADKQFVTVKFDKSEQKIKDATDKGIGVGSYFAFKNAVEKVEDKNHNTADSSFNNVRDTVDMLENGTFKDMTDAQKEYLFASTDRSIQNNPYHESDVEKKAESNDYYKKLTGKDKMYFRSLASEYEDAVKNNKSLDGWIAKAKLASEHGVIEPYQYVAYQHALLYANTDNNDNYKQSEVTAAINSLSGLTQQQKAYLWQSANKKWKANKNPFGNATVYWPEEDKKDGSAGAKIDKRVGAMMGSGK